MTKTEICNEIQRIMALYAGEVIAYESWSGDHCAERIREIPERMKESRPELFGIDPNGMTLEELKACGFGRWSEDNEMMLIPISLLPFLADEFEGACIMSEEKRLLKRDEMDNDHRGGFLAYGVYPA